MVAHGHRIIEASDAFRPMVQHMRGQLIAAAADRANMTPEEYRPLNGFETVMAVWR